MSSAPELRKPTFVKVKDLQKLRSGYNVYVKVVSADVKDIETRDGQKIRMVDAIVGDQTAVAKAFFKGQNATVVQKGAVIAIRNGVKKYIKNFISLELDIFGRVTKQSVDITVDQSYNISEHQHKLPEGRQRGQRNFSQGRRNNRPFNNRRPNNRPQRRFDNRPQRNFEDRPQRRNEGQGQRQQPRGDREGRTNERRNDRPQRRDNNRSYDRDFDRRRQYNNDRPPRRQPQRYEPRRQQYRERAPIQWTKIDQISPGDDRLNLIVKVLSQQLVQGKNRNMIRCTLGDETGTVRAFLQDAPALRVGKSVVLFDCEARVIKQHIELNSRGRIDTARRQVERVNEKFNLSQKSWVPVNQ